MTFHSLVLPQISTRRNLAVTAVWPWLLPPGGNSPCYLNFRPYYLGLNTVGACSSVQQLPHSALTRGWALSILYSSHTTLKQDSHIDLKRLGYLPEVSQPGARLDWYEHWQCDWALTFELLSGYTFLFFFSDYAKHFYYFISSVACISFWINLFCKDFYFPLRQHLMISSSPPWPLTLYVAGLWEF